MAFREKSFQDVFRNSNVVERKRILAKLLNYPHFNEEDDLRTAILLDVHYEMLSHLVNDGFLWQQIASFFPIFERMLSKVKGKSLEDAILTFKDELHSKGTHFCQSNLKSVIDYTFLTLFQHYKLYQFVLTKDRADQTTKLYYTIEPPPTTLHMREGFAKSIWDEQQKLKQIEQMQQHRCEERSTQFEEEMQHAVHHLDKQLRELDSFPAQHLTKENLEAIVSNITASKAAVASVSLCQNITELHDSLEFRFHRNRLGNEANEERKTASSGRQTNSKSGKK